MKESEILQALFSTLPHVFGEDEPDDKERNWTGITERGKTRQDDGE